MSKFTDEELNESMGEYARNYDDNKFWNVIKKSAGKIGKDVIGKALSLYYVLKKDNIPLSVKGIIVGALGYLIMPIDLIPDIVPMLGWTDDAAAIAMALAQINSYVDVEVKRQAEEKVKELVG